MRNRKSKAAVVWIPVAVLSLLGVGTAGYLASKKKKAKHLSKKQ